MSLNWNAKALTERGFNIWYQRPANPQTGEEAGEYLNPVTDALIWATLIVGCDGSKIGTFAQRVRQYEQATGPLLRRPKDITAAIAANAIRPDTFTDEGFITLSELHRHEGLKTNVTHLTNVAWGKKLGQIVAERAAESLNRERNQKGA